ncbi:hypothetical protein Hanom_Chr05g00392341 [Helianthus anomalus]
MLTLSFPIVEAAEDHHIGWIPTTADGGGCRGSIAVCLAKGDVIYASILIIHIPTLSFPVVEAVGDHHIGWILITAGGGSGCHGSMAECLTEGGDLNIDDMELWMDNAINRLDSTKVKGLNRNILRV